MNKLRLVEVQLQYVAVYDDGETLEKIVSQPITVPAKSWPKIGEQIESDLTRLTEQIEEAGGLEALQEQIRQQQR